MSKTELEAEPGENTIEIFYENAVNERTIIKFYATEDVQIFVRLGIKSGLNIKLWTIVNKVDTIYKEKVPSTAA